MQRIIFLSMALLVVMSFAKGQSCGTCSITVTGIDSASYSIGVGSTFCLDSTAKFTGTLVLTGGTVCNKGVFKAQTFTFTSGTVNNYGSMSIQGNVAVSSGNNLFCERKSFLKVGGQLSVSGGQFTNNGISNIGGVFQYSSGIVNNTGIVNCQTFTGSLSSISNTGIINKD